MKNEIRTKLIRITYDKRLLNKTVMQYYRDLKKAAEALEQLTGKKKKSGN